MGATGTMTKSARFEQELNRALLTDKQEGAGSNFTNRLLDY